MEDEVKCALCEQFFKEGEVVWLAVGGEEEPYCQQCGGVFKHGEVSI